MAIGAVSVAEGLRMFNLLVKSGEWTEGTETVLAGRMFEYTPEAATEKFNPKGVTDFDKLIKLPCLFMAEGAGSELAHVGTLSAARKMGNTVEIECHFDRRIPPFRNEDIFAQRNDFGIADNFEFSRNHWAIKDLNLYRAIARNPAPIRQKPKVFKLADRDVVDPDLVSVMMPFDASSKAVYRRIKAAAEEAGYKCQRVDEIWDKPEIIADVVSLIERSAVVICDCSGRNANVFYEMGIAHTLGREVIAITQSEHDIPFDIRHLRYVHYLNNTEGQKLLAGTLRDRLTSLK